jgi:O-methyltransferase domain
MVDAVVRSYDFSGIGVLLDVGGGEGALLTAILAAKPSLRDILFDQPDVVRTARALLERASVADRCEIVGGSFFDTVPAGADACLLRSVIYDWDDEAAIEALPIAQPRTKFYVPDARYVSLPLSSDFTSW